MAYIVMAHIAMACIMCEDMRADMREDMHADMCKDMRADI